MRIVSALSITHIALAFSRLGLAGVGKVHIFPVRHIQERMVPRLLPIRSVLHNARILLMKARLHRQINHLARLAVGLSPPLLLLVQDKQHAHLQNDNGNKGREDTQTCSQSGEVSRCVLLTEKEWADDIASCRGGIKETRKNALLRCTSCVSDDPRDDKRIAAE